MKEQEQLDNINSESELKCKKQDKPVKEKKVSKSSATLRQF